MTKDDDVLQAHSISASACSFCPGVHINLYDCEGGLIATAVMPAAMVIDFIAQVRAAKKELSTRHSTTPVRQ